MAIQSLPGATGFTYARVASMDKRAVGKLTDANHLESFHSTEPADYDKKIISLYTQSSLYSNDFLDMINKSTPYYIDNNSDSWKWNIQYLKYNNIFKKLFGRESNFCGFCFKRV
jgi:hypothetical protein